MPVDQKVFDKLSNEEKQIYFELKRLSSKKFKIMTKAMFEWQTNVYHLMDFVCITNKGIFVIKSIEVNGWVYGEEHDESWKIKSIENGDLFISNPVKENARNASLLRQLLMESGLLLGPFMGSLPIHNIVIFNQQCNIDGVKSTQPVIKLSKVKELLFGYKIIEITDLEIESYFSYLMKKNVNDEAIRNTVMDGSRQSTYMQENGNTPHIIKNQKVFMYITTFLVMLLILIAFLVVLVLPSSLEKNILPSQFTIEEISD